MLGVTLSGAGADSGVLGRESEQAPAAADFVEWSNGQMGSLPRPGVCSVT